MGSGMWMNLDPSNVHLSVRQILILTKLEAVNSRRVSGMFFADILCLCHTLGGQAVNTSLHGVKFFGCCCFPCLACLALLYSVMSSC